MEQDRPPIPARRQVRLPCPDLRLRAVTQLSLCGWASWPATHLSLSATGRVTWKAPRTEPSHLSRETRVETCTAAFKGRGKRCATAGGRAIPPLMISPRLTGDDIRPAYWKGVVGSHTIHFRMQPYVVEVARILHWNMDTERHLEPDCRAQVRAQSPGNENALRTISSRLMAGPELRPDNALTCHHRMIRPRSSSTSPVSSPCGNRVGERDDCP